MINLKNCWLTLVRWWRMVISNILCTKIEYKMWFFASLPKIKKILKLKKFTKVKIPNANCKQQMLVDQAQPLNLHKHKQNFHLINCSDLKTFKKAFTMKNIEIILNEYRFKPREIFWYYIEIISPQITPRQWTWKLRILSVS